MVENSQKNSARARSIATIAVVEELTARRVVGKVRLAQIHGRRVVACYEIRAGYSTFPGQTGEAGEQNIDRVGARLKVKDMGTAIAWRVEDEVIGRRTVRRFRCSDDRASNIVARKSDGRVR